MHAQNNDFNVLFTLHDENLSSYFLIFFSSEQRHNVIYFIYSTCCNCNNTHNSDAIKKGNWVQHMLTLFGWKLAQKCAECERKLHRLFHFHSFFFIIIIIIFCCCFSTLSIHCIAVCGRIVERNRWKVSHYAGLWKKWVERKNKSNNKRIIFGKELVAWWIEG